MAIRFLVASVGLLAMVPAGGAEPLQPGGSGPRVGWEATVDTGFGLSGAARGGESVNALPLAALEGERTLGETDDRAVSYRLSALALEGRGPTGRFVGDFLTVSNAEGHASARLYAWWAQLAAGLWSVRAGALLADEEFLATGPGGELINASFGWPAFVSANTVNTGPAFFAAAPGLRLEARPMSALVWRAGLYDGDAFDSREGDPRVNRDGLSLRLGGDQGAFLITELEWAPPEGPWRGLAGGWWHTADFENLRDDDAGRPFALSGGAPRTHAGNGGLFVALERAWRGPAGEPGTIESHVRAGLSRRDRSPVAWAADVAVAWRGPHPARRGDALALGWSRARFSSALADTVRLAASGEPEPSFEEVVELSYTWVVSDSLTVQPDLQWIRRVGGIREGGNALVGLVRLRWAR